MAVSINYASSSLGNADLEKQYEDALRQVRNTSPETLPLVINGEEVTSKQVVERFDPCNLDTLVGSAFAATPKQVEQAVAAAHAMRKQWRNTSYQDRVFAIRKAKDVINENLMFI